MRFNRILSSALVLVAAAALGGCYHSGGPLVARDSLEETRALEPEEARALEAVAAGATFGVLCEHIAADCGEEEAPARAAGWLAGWVDAGWVRRPGASSTADAPGGRRFLQAGSPARR